MMHFLFSRKPLTTGFRLLAPVLAALVVGGILVVAADPAHADTSAETAKGAKGPSMPPGKASIDTSMCSEPEVSQPFLFAKDNHLYTLMPGESESGFDGAGWELRGEASIVTTTLPDGTTTQALDLPSGSEAVSPTICVDQTYPIARTMVRNANGGDDVHVFVSYEGTKTWEEPKGTSKVHGNAKKEWTVSSPINLQPNKSAGWQRLRLLLVGGGKSSEFQIYNLYVDPRMSH